MTTSVPSVLSKDVALASGKAFASANTWCVLLCVNVNTGAWCCRFCCVHECITGQEQKIGTVY
jgi:hypothetical protein